MEDFNWSLLITKTFYKNHCAHLTVYGKCCYIYIHAYIITADHFSLLISSMHSNLSDVTHFEKKMSTELK